jgi:hypothetical protein
VHAQQPKPVTPISKTGSTGFLQHLTPKQVTPVSKTGPTSFLQLYTPKAKYAKEMHKLPLDNCDRF